MIEIKNVTFHYSGLDQAGLCDFNLSVTDGECILLCGASGCGKTTVTRLINGLIPHFFKGELTGDVYVNGLDMPFAHLLPEMTSNMLVPLFIIVYLFVLDWRMALLSLATLFIGLVIMSIGMRNYATEGAGAMAASKKMADAAGDRSSYSKIDFHSRKKAERTEGTSRSCFGIHPRHGCGKILWF